MFTRFTVLVLLLLGSFARAGALSEVSQVVFTPDGRYVLAVVVCEGQETVHQSARLQVLSTGTGNTVWRSELPHRDDSDTEAGTKAQRLLKTHWPALQKQFGFQAFTLSQPRYRLPRQMDFPTKGVSPGQVERLAVPLWSRPVPITLGVFSSTKPCKAQTHLMRYPEWQDWAAAGYRLQIGTQTIGQGAADCANMYSVSRVDVKGNRVLVALNAFWPGFDGSNSDQLLLALTLK